MTYTRKKPCMHSK